MMVRIEYDGYNRYFRILDHELDWLFQHGDVYVLVVSESESDPEVEWIEFRHTPIAHA